MGEAARRLCRYGVSDEVSRTSSGSAFNYQLVTLDAARFFPVVTFADGGANRVRGGQAITTGTTGASAYDIGRFTLHGDLGLGLRFDIPQLGLRTLRLDFAKGSQGTHTSFGIGHSF